MVRITANFLSDSAWVATYIEENRRLLAEAYTFMVSWAERHGIKYAPGASAAFFFWADLGTAYAKALGLGESTAAVEEELNTKLLARKGFIAQGSTFAAEEPGWFRIVFAYDRHNLEEGLRRIIEVIEDE
jgi:1-aminocyclopropane-1-carboxylate synthase